MERMERVLHRYPLLANVSPLDYNVNIKTNKQKEMRNEMKKITVEVMFSTGGEFTHIVEVYSDSQCLAVLSGALFAGSTIKSFEIVEVV